VNSINSDLWDYDQLFLKMNESIVSAIEGGSGVVDLKGLSEQYRGRQTLRVYCQERSKALHKDALKIGVDSLTDSP
jgi:DNA/RNA endonuclease YhcR with UshA esterase domain